MARNGHPATAKLNLRKLDEDRRNLTVYDGAKLELAIKHLLKMVGE
jgi:hypothetical protein